MMGIWFIVAVILTSQDFFAVDAFASTGRQSWGMDARVRQNWHTSSNAVNIRTTDNQQQRSSCSSTTLLATPEFRPVPSEQEGIPIPFIDVDGRKFIECYADSIAQVDGVEYTIGVPCDYAVALCYFRQDQQLIPIELNDPLMDDVFPIAESIVEEEFGDELVLQRTPQTLTLVGELEDDEDEEDDDFDLDDDSEDDDDDDDGDEEVEVLLAFEQDGRQYNLVRMLDPMLLVGKLDEEEPDKRILLTPEESEKVMPVLEDMFLEFREDLGDVKP